MCVEKERDRELTLWLIIVLQNTIVLLQAAMFPFFIFQTKKIAQYVGHNVTLKMYHNSGNHSNCFVVICNCLMDVDVCKERCIERERERLFCIIM